MVPQFAVLQSAAVAVGEAGQGRGGRVQEGGGAVGEVGRGRRGRVREGTESAGGAGQGRENRVREGAGVGDLLPPGPESWRWS